MSVSFFLVGAVLDIKQFTRSFHLLLCSLVIMTKDKSKYKIKLHDHNTSHYYTRPQNNLIRYMEVIMQQNFLVLIFPQLMKPFLKFLQLIGDSTHIKNLIISNK